MITKAEIDGLLGNYTVVKEYPNSGQKKVFLVQDGEIYKIAKVIARGDERVLREIEIVTEYEIPNVPEIYDMVNVTDSSGTEYSCIFEEYIEGVTLRERLSSGKLTLIEGVNLLETLLNIAVVLEEIRIVHRDIKPDNIICTNDGQYYLIDFGIARRLDKASLTMTQASMVCFVKWFSLV